MTTILIEKNIMVPLRDGVQLATDIYRLQGASPTPVLVVRTPYNKDGLAGGANFTTEELLKVISLVQDLAASRLTGSMLGFTVNAAGSPVTNKIAVQRMYDIDKRINTAKEIAGLT